MDCLHWIDFKEKNQLEVAQGRVGKLMSHPIVERAFNEFSEVGRISVVIELKIRLLTNKIPEIKEFAPTKFQKWRQLCCHTLTQTN